MTVNISVYDPTAPELAGVQLQRRALDDLKGKVVGFIDNSKPNFNYLVDDLAELLVSRHGVKSTVKHRKRMASIPAPEEVMQDLAGQCDLVITGSGD